MLGIPPRILLSKIFLSTNFLYFIPFSLKRLSRQLLIDAYLLCCRALFDLIAIFLSIKKSLYPTNKKMTGEAKIPFEMLIKHLVKLMKYN